MNFIVSHTTRYRYARAVNLGPHVIRLHPRGDGNLLLLNYSCDIAPEPCAKSYCVDSEGNLVLRARFDTPTRELDITSRLEATTFPDKGYEPTEHNLLPVNYPNDDALHLAPYYPETVLEPPAQKLLAELLEASDQQPLRFLERLNAYLYKNIQREIRHSGDPQTPAQTLVRRRGACRDVSVLFMAMSRAQGFAARFVSGYQAKPEVDHGQRFLHAWPEVYIPGVGWRGYDPSHGTGVAEAHVAVAASHTPAGAAPVEGSYYGDAVENQMEYAISIDAQ